MQRIGLSLAAVFLTAATAWGQFDNLPDAPGIPPKPAGPGGPRLEKPITQQWRTGVVIRALGGPCANLSGTFPVPMDWPEQQVKVKEERSSTHIRRVTFRNTDGLLRQAMFEVPMVPTGEMAEIVLIYDVTNFVQVAPTDTAGYIVPQKLPSAMRKYLGPSPQIESTNIKFRNLVKDATEGKATAWEQVEAIYDAVREKVKYERDRTKIKGAATALTDGKADREDLTSVFVAACRAWKVPARMVWVPDSCYAEFYLEDAENAGRWFPAMVVGDKQFGGLSTYHPILQKGDNIRVPEAKDPQKFVPEFLTGKGKSGGRPDVEFVRRLEGLP